ncbi:MAG: ABC transporter ATP-binding protein [Caldilineaceae bacterium]|nr:ABC transporter ATP-binding protein [Caldilineaceae bacterium]
MNHESHNIQYPIPAIQSPMPTIAEVDNLTFRYGDRQPPVFDGFSWRVEAGEMWAVLGPSGCGKSTLLYLLAGLRQPTSGEIRVEGSLLSRPRASTGLILQGHGLMPWATVWENAALGARIGHFYKWKGERAGEVRPYPPPLPLDDADRWLARLGLADLRDKYPSQLSGGQQQRVAIARTLVLRPRLLLMDEPFSALDTVTRGDLQGLVLALQEELKMTSVLVTHNIEEAALLGRRILVLHRPPNRSPQIVENPQAGALDYRQGEAFHAVIGQLQQLLAQDGESLR